MARRLVLVKHALPIPDSSVPAGEWSLGPEGEAQARALQTTLREFAPYTLLASTEAKARRTAEIIGTPVTDDGLREIHRPVLPWMGADEHKAFNRGLFEQPNVAVVGDESANDALARFEQAINAHTAAGTGNVVAVSHGTVIALFVAQHDPNVDAFALWQELQCADFVVLSLPGFARIA